MIVARPSGSWPNRITLMISARSPRAEVEHRGFPRDVCHRHWRHGAHAALKWGGMRAAMAPSVSSWTTPSIPSRPPSRAEPPPRRSNAKKSCRSSAMAAQRSSPSKLNRVGVLLDLPRNTFEPPSEQVTANERSVSLQPQGCSTIDEGELKPSRNGQCWLNEREAPDHMGPGPLVQLRSFT